MRGSRRAAIALLLVVLLALISFRAKFEWLWSNQRMIQQVPNNRLQLQLSIPASRPAAAAAATATAVTAGGRALTRVPTSVAAGGAASAGRRRGGISRARGCCRGVLSRHKGGSGRGKRSGCRSGGGGGGGSRSSREVGAGGGQACPAGDRGNGAELPGHAGYLVHRVSDPGRSASRHRPQGKPEVLPRLQQGGCWQAGGAGARGGCYLDCIQAGGRVQRRGLAALVQRRRP